MVRRLTLVFMLSAAAFAQAPGRALDYPHPRQLAVVGGTLLDLRNGSRLENSVVLIEGQRISKVGDANSVGIPRDAQIVDAHGKWIIPGLMDMHSHVAGEDSHALPMGLYLANGVTTIRDPGGSTAVARVMKDDIDSGKRVGPRLLFCGEVLDGMPPVAPHFSIIVDTPDRARTAVEFLAGQGVHCIKVYNNVKEPELKGIIQAARARNLPVIGHVPRVLTMTHAVELGMQGLEHVRITGRELLPIEEADKIDFLPYARREALLWRQFDLQSPKMKTLVSFLAESKVFLDPTLTVEEDGTILSNEDQIRDPNNRYLPPRLFERWKQELPPDYAKLPDELRRTAADGFQKRKAFVGMCARAGVRLLAGTDGAAYGTLLPGFGLHHELQLLVQSGLTPLQSLQAATVSAAEALGKPHELGAVAPNYLADLVILQADPLADIRNAARVFLVIKDGIVYSPEDLLKSASSQ